VSSARAYSPWRDGAPVKHARAIVAQNWKLVTAAAVTRWKLSVETRELGELFDLAVDPLEQLGAIDAGGTQRMLLTALLKSHERTGRLVRATHPPTPLTR